MARLLCLAALLGCANRQPAPANPPPPPDNEPSERLSPTQLACRADENMHILSLSNVLTAGCDRTGRSPFAFAQAFFDTGTLDGEYMAKHALSAGVFLCICKHVPCGDEGTRNVAALARKSALELQQTEGDGVGRITANIGGHECLEAAAAAELYKLGLWCAFDRWPRTSEAFDERTRILREESDEVRATCEDVLTDKSGT